MRLDCLASSSNSTRARRGELTPTCTSSEPSVEAAESADGAGESEGVSDAAPEESGALPIGAQAPSISASPNITKTLRNLPLFGAKSILGMIYTSFLYVRELLRADPV
jgi:hypothetical protein